MLNEDKTQEKHHKKYKYWFGKPIIFLLSGSIMIGHGLRMISQGVFHPGSAYIPNTFDLFFDWLTLAVLGTIILYYAFSGFFYNFKQKNTGSIYILD